MKRIEVDGWAPSYLVFIGLCSGGLMFQGKLWTGIASWALLIAGLYVYLFAFKPRTVSTADTEQSK